ncbi:PREDICTED: probable 1-acyl-sn-glycerol-3-phosphate acyltransferase 5 [Tarenaya hassleriana]|uniref:probable 1-acyl-sn-glycerol-3-phosphate acyltransferase 5 n=1 Tax=Tarenaya hassleriana TaxID=28532 RepID=UPI00053C555D|nr:PREDICTED: probable 1-acyl-sn-glycerol-3-phosphate acyltransferase 5 [Tarenaya hassleriana]XP_010521077.1 PREDICTED: probable 1-acyl-sn-glycerol-3-phosphate acyltransferase 5 [Tarenaya hassleriana]
MGKAIAKGSKNVKPDCTFSRIRLVRGVICLLVLFSTALTMLIFCGFPTGVALRLFSVHYSRRTLSFFFGSWLALWPFLFEKINGTKVVFSGDRVPPEERVLLIANHRTEVDWMYFWDLALRKGRVGDIKYILKSSLMKLPVFGWAFHLLEFIPVERKWEIDEVKIRRILSTLRDPRDPLWLALFPEGTDYTEAKCERSRKFAAENGFPVLNNVLLPKTKGFISCLTELRSSLDAVYDVTIGYKTRCPSFLDNVYGVEPSEVHIHIRRIIPNHIPTEEKGISAWLIEAFEFKDRLLGEFYSKGNFPNEGGTETDLSSDRNLMNCLAVIIFTVTCTYLTLFGSVWFKIYVSLVCAYMTSATRFDLRPLPLVEAVKTMFRIRKS